YFIATSAATEPNPWASETAATCCLVGITTAMVRSTPRARSARASTRMTGWPASTCWPASTRRVNPSPCRLTVSKPMWTKTSKPALVVMEKAWLVLNTIDNCPEAGAHTSKPEADSTGTSANPSPTDLEEKASSATFSNGITVPTVGLDSSTAVATPVETGATS